MKKTLLLLLLSCFALTGCDKVMDDVENDSPENGTNINSVTNKDEAVLKNLLHKYSDVEYNKVMADARKVDYFKGKSVAYLGASLVNLPECSMARFIVEKGLGCSITHYGHGGYGYAAKNNLQGYARNMGKHDVYIIWGTTNDYSLDVPIGSPTDYTEADGFDESKLNTACGGMNYAIAQARRINPDALILGYTTVKMFNGVRLDGSMRSSTYTNGAGYHFYDYVDAQLACFERANIPCLNVWDWEFFNHSNWTDFYMKDGTHMQKSGYFFLALEHLKFLVKMGK